MHNVIAERTLTLLEPDGSARQVFVRLGKPEESLQHDDYHCPVQIIGLGEKSSSLRMTLLPSPRSR